MIMNKKNNYFKYAALIIIGFFISIIFTTVINGFLFSMYLDRSASRISLALIEKDDIGIQRYEEEINFLFGKKVSLISALQKDKTDISLFNEKCFYVSKKDLLYLSQKTGEVNICYAAGRFFKEIIYGHYFYVSLLLLLIIFIFSSEYSKNSTEIEINNLIDALEANVKSGKRLNLESKNPLFNKIESLICDREKLALDNAVSKVELEKQSEITQIARMVAHDIRTPLSSLNLALYGLDGIESQRLKIIKESLNRIQIIASDLLVRSRKEVGIRENINLKHEKVNLIFLISEIINEYVSHSKIKFILKKNYSEEVNIMASSISLYRIFSNIINNAIEAVEKCKEPVIIIQIEKAIKNVSVLIYDNGEGFPLEVIETGGKKNISMGKQNGNGLGISSAFNYMNSIGGSISLFNNQGANIKFTFPS